MSRRSPFLTLTLAVFSILLVIALISNPDPSFKAAVRGLEIWWEVVFPALLPFIVVSEVLMGVGVVHFVGVLLEPLMRPFFNVPGTGGFVLTMGFSSGYPVAAKLTTRLREQGNITRAEGERLVSFATTGDPLFVIGAVAVGFFHSEQVGFVLAVTHYLSALLIGVCYRFHDPGAATSQSTEASRHPLMYRALQAMHRARLRDNRPFGQLMGDAVQSALQMLLVVGGFIIVFSVIINLLSVTNLTPFFSTLLGIVLGPLGFPPEFAKATIAGLFEVTLGAKEASAVGGEIPMIWKAAMAAALVSWGGLSVHAQVASILSKTDIRVTPYLVARGVHAFAAAILTLILWKPLTEVSQGWLNSVPVFNIGHVHPTWTGWWDTLAQMSLLALGLCMVLFLLTVWARKMVR
ncbi:sporulation integral membrane protein YlbJ [Brevibacillus dissolubilis]|uniref:sporulation integral membrane protein YlbJ n=1 Tax=Brevibacillus dissolubilis TaxID=1844116 RepID=UPI00111711DC|nr:sporulation integral membrane protein YlbJ [Brevibacillus dissolubilis]